jgi:hypothetical protein
LKQFRQNTTISFNKFKAVQIPPKYVTTWDLGLETHPVFWWSHPQVVSGSHGHTICPCIMYHYSCSLKIKQRIHQNQGQSDWKGARLSLYSLNHSSLHPVVKAQYHTKTMYISMRLQRKLHNNKLKIKQQ